MWLLGLVLAACDPGVALVNPTLWMQSAAEYRASALQTYAIARRELDKALAERGDKPPAIILDLDETVLDNSSFAAQSIRNHTTFKFGDDWSRWVAQSASSAIPGARDFLVYAKSRGVTPIYITNRTHAMKAATLANLEKLGFPVTEDTILTRGESTDKTARRDDVAARYRVIMFFGDAMSDFPKGGDDTPWGTRWFMLPNAMYGSWERSPCDTRPATP